MKKEIIFTSFLFVIFFNSVLAQNPTFEWAKSIGAINYDYSYDIAIDGSGNIYTTGFFQGTVDFDPGPDVFNLSTARSGLFICKLDTLGNFVWAKAFTGTYSCQGNAIALDSSGNIYLTGSFEGTIDFDP